MVFRGKELLFYCILAFCFWSGSEGQLEKEAADKLKLLQDAWANTQEKSYYKMEKKDEVGISLTQPGKEDTAQKTTTVDNAEFVFRKTEDQEDPDFHGTVDMGDRSFEILVLDGMMYFKLTKGFPEDAQKVWFSGQDEQLSDITRGFAGTFKVEEVDNSLSTENVKGIVEAEKIDGAPASSSCYDITPTDEYKASKSADPTFEVSIYTITICMDTEKNVLLKTTFKFTESGPWVDEEVNEAELKVERDTDITFSDFDVEVDFPVLDLSKFTAGKDATDGDVEQEAANGGDVEQEAANGEEVEKLSLSGKPGAPGKPGGSAGAPGAPGASGGRGGAPGAPGAPGDNSASCASRIPIILVVLSMLLLL